MAEKKKQKDIIKSKEITKRTDNKKSTKKDDALSQDRLLFLVTIVPRNKAEFYVDLIQGFESNLQLASIARGTASKEILSVLGLANSKKSVIFSVIREEREDEILKMLDNRFKTIKNGKGIACTVPFNSLIGVSSYGFLSNNEHVIGKGI